MQAQFDEPARFDSYNGAGGTVSRAYLPYACLIVSMIVLQKIAFGGVLGLDALLTWAGLLWMAARGDLEVVIPRLLLFLAFVVSLLISLMLNGQASKITSLGVLIFMYAVFVFRLRLAPGNVEKFLNVFQKCMVLVAVVVVAQQAIQYTIGSAYWINLNTIIPASLQYVGFAYIRPYEWNSPMLEPNAVVFLEPSVVSSYLSIAVIIEMAIFKRLRPGLLFLAAMVACRAGTGPATLAIVSPLLFTKLNRRIILPVVAAFAILLLIVSTFGVLDPLLARSDEFSNPNSSGYSRIMKPIETAATQLAKPGSVFSGRGPGEAPKGINEVEWPFSKILVEYGFLAAILFHLYLIYSVMQSPVDRIIGLGLLVPHLLFGGGFVSHANIMLLMLLGSLLKADHRIRDALQPVADHAHRPRAAYDTTPASLAQRMG
jgi:hypothetical protein